LPLGIAVGFEPIPLRKPSGAVHVLVDVPYQMPIVMGNRQYLRTHEGRLGAKRPLSLRAGTRPSRAAVRPWLAKRAPRNPPGSPPQWKGWDAVRGNIPAPPKAAKPIAKRQTMVRWL